MKVIILGASGKSSLFPTPVALSRQPPAEPGLPLLAINVLTPDAGFVAFPIAQAFARAGHIVYGTTRSAENAKALARDEILPIVCDATNDEGRALWGKEAETADLSEYYTAAREARGSISSISPIGAIRLVDVEAHFPVIDAIPSTTGAAPALATFKYASAISDGRPVGAKITYIYTAGAAAWTSDTQPHSGRVGLTTWRWGVEKEVLSSESAGRTSSALRVLVLAKSTRYAARFPLHTSHSTLHAPHSFAGDRIGIGLVVTMELNAYSLVGNAVNGIVIRPTLLYGKAGSLYSLFYFHAALAAAQKGEPFEAVAHPDFRLANIHPDDLADLYLRVGERVRESLVAGRRRC
jgi:hypothetical protein